MRIFQTIFNNIYGPEYYRGILSRPFSYSLKYFLALIVGAALVGAVFSGTTLPDTIRFFKDVSSSVVAEYPEDLEITVKDGIASSNQEAPHAFSFPISGQYGQYTITEEALREYGIAENIIVVDTKTPFSFEQFDEHRTMVLLKEKHIALRSSPDEEITLYPLKNAPDITLDRETVVSFLEGVMPWYPFFGVLLLVGIFALFFALFAFKALYLLPAALVIWAIMKLKRARAGYLKAYQTGLHAMTFAIIIDTLLLKLLMGVDAPWIFSLLTLFVVAVNVGAETKNTGKEDMAS